MITALSPIGLVFESSYMLSIVPPAPDVAPDIEPLSLNPKLNVSLLNPTSPVPSPLLVNLYTCPLDTAESDIEPLLATVVNTFVSLFNELADAIDIAFIVEFDVNGCVLIVNVTNPFANVCFVLPFFIPKTVLLEKKTSPIALTVLFFTCTIDEPIWKFSVLPVVVLLELDVF